MASAAAGQQAPPKLPAVGVVPAAVRKPVTRAFKPICRPYRGDRTGQSPRARVAAFLDAPLFTEGAEVKKDQPLYRLEQPPFQADVKAKEATIAQLKAELVNAHIVLGRAKALLNTPAGQQSTVDAATANPRRSRPRCTGPKPN